VQADFSADRRATIPRLMPVQMLQLPTTNVSRTQEEVFSTGEHWKTAMAEQGWR